MNYFYLVVIIFFIILCAYLYKEVSNQTHKNKSPPNSNVGLNVLVPSPYGFLSWTQGIAPTTYEAWSSGPSFKKSGSDLIAPINQPDGSISFSPTNSYTPSIRTIQLVAMRYYFSNTDVPINLSFVIKEIKPKDPNNPATPQEIPIANDIKSSSFNDQGRATSFINFLTSTITIDSDHELDLKLSSIFCGTRGCYFPNSFVVLKVKIS